MKKALSILLVVLFLVPSFVMAQGAAETKAPEAGKESAEAQWAIDNGLDLDESEEELYRKALEEGGKVVIYTASSRHAKVKADFEAKYPGMELIAYNINTGEIIEKLRTEYASGLRVADIVQSKEVSGQYTLEFFADGVLHNYQPDSIWGNVNPQYKANVTPFFLELSAWFYNDSVYTDGCPIDSWWDLIRPEWNGKVIFQDPASSPSYMTFITIMTRPDVAEMMAEVYKEEFGEDIVLAKDEPNAGYAWINRFLKTDFILSSSADETVDAIGTAPGVDLIGYSSSSKIREKSGKLPYLQLEMTNFKPAIGACAINFVSIVNEAPHPNGAKLYLKYVMGGLDGQGAGFKPFNTLGSFPVRPENPVVDGAIPISEITLFSDDYEYVADNSSAVYDYWLERL